MIQVTMRDQNSLTGQTMELETADDVIDIAARVDHQCILGLRVPDYATVALQRWHWEDFDYGSHRSGGSLL